MKLTMNFHLHDLQAFAAVAEHGSFRRAAESIHISQPAFSRRIDKLEEALGVKLLDRNTRRVRLTALGVELARKAKLLLEDLDDILLGVKDVAAMRTGEIKIAGVHTAAWHFLPSVLAEFAKAYPKVRVRVLDGGANEVLSNVAQGLADIGLNFIGRQEPDLDFVPLLQERFVLACKRGHVLTKRASVRWQDLKNHHLMGLNRASGNRLILDLALAHVTERPDTFYEAQHVQSLLGMVEAGIGVAVVPQLVMPGAAHKGLVAVALTEPEVQRELGLITRRGQTLSPAAQVLFDMLLAKGRCS